MMSKFVIQTSRLEIRRRGFSLVEVLMALGVFGVGLSMVAALFP
ncbi:MAG: prepilin-type N-terminal cleavage/methylation domain-containing protein, partial [Phycisphaerae bacterium]|nr:prepilin-type N-terminal cleavage/methylation domain-containing protein [Phycisphaerae bacterium]